MNKAFLLLESIGRVSDETLERCETARPIPWRRWTAAAACCGLLVTGLFLLSPGIQEEGTVDHPPTQTQDEKADSAQRTKTDPDRVRKTLTFAQAQTVPVLGDYLPQEAPAGFYEESVFWESGPEGETLSVLWCKAGSYDELRWMVRPWTEADRQNLTAPDQPERYDLSRYPIPRAESVPEALREVVDCPVFRAGDLSPEVLRRRADVVPEAGDSALRFRFAVTYGDWVVELSGKGGDLAWVGQQLAVLPYGDG